MTSKDEHFYRNGFRALPERWTKVVANDGQYFELFIYNHFFTIKPPERQAILYCSTREKKVIFRV